MPALGKSGTCLIFALSVSMADLGSTSLSNTKPTEPARRHRVFHVEMFDARAARSVAQLPFEPIDRLGFPFRLRFDAPVGQVTHPAVQPLAAGRPLRKEPEADALHAAADEKPTGDPHLKAACLSSFQS